jgi:hypothetical protein
MLVTCDLVENPLLGEVLRVLLLGEPLLLQAFERLMLLGGAGQDASALLGVGAAAREFVLRLLLLMLDTLQIRLPLNECGGAEQLLRVTPRRLSGADVCLRLLELRLTIGLTLQGLRQLLLGLVLTLLAQRSNTLEAEPESRHTALNRHLLPGG